MAIPPHSWIFPPHFLGEWGGLKKFSPPHPGGGQKSPPQTFSRRVKIPPRIKITRCVPPRMGGSSLQNLKSCSPPFWGGACKIFRFMLPRVLPPRMGGSTPKFLRACGGLRKNTVSMMKNSSKIVFLGAKTEKKSRASRVYYFHR